MFSQIGTELYHSFFAGRQSAEIKRWRRVCGLVNIVNALAGICSLKTSLGWGWRMGQSCESVLQASSNYCCFLLVMG